MRTSLSMLVAFAAIAIFLPVDAEACGCCGCTPSAKADAGHDHAAKADIVDTAVAAGQFNNLVAAVKAAGLVETLKSDGPFTVFAPVDSAFAKLPEGTVAALLKDRPALANILKYHVVPGRLSANDVVGKTWLSTAQGQSLKVSVAGDEVRIDGARVVKADIKVSNGIIHVIDTVMLPRKNLAETAAAAGRFKTLLAAAKAAGLVDALTDGGPFTVFAPSDDAFAKLPAGTVEALLNDIPKLKTILMYHVVPGRILSTDLRPGTVQPKTAEGRALSVTRSDSGAVRANGSNVVEADIIAGNGVIHVVDSVILPR